MKNKQEKKTLSKKEKTLKKEILLIEKILCEKDNNIRNTKLNFKFFTKKARRLYADGKYAKLVFSRSDLNWVLNKTINRIMRKGKKEKIENQIKKYFVSKNKTKKKKNRPKKILTFLLCILTLFRPVVLLDKEVVLEKEMFLVEKKKPKRKLKKKKKKSNIWVANLLPVKRQYSAALIWILEGIKNNNLKKNEGQKSAKKTKKKLVVSIYKKIEFIFDRLCVKKKTDFFLWKKSEMYSKIINQERRKARRRWK